MVIKSAVNLILGAGTNNFVWLVVSVVMAVWLATRKKGANYGVGVVLALLFLLNLKTNIAGRYWFYLAEGIADAACAVALFINKNIKAFFDIG
jgi:hypothetical protein